MLPTFEVATRYATFTFLADELCISQSAVSHQLKNLEDLWGLQLFQRGKILCLPEPHRRKLLQNAVAGLMVLAGRRAGMFAREDIRELARTRLISIWLRIQGIITVRGYRYIIPCSAAWRCQSSTTV